MTAAHWTAGSGDGVFVRDVLVDHPAPGGTVRALELASFEVAAGDAVAVMGPSGSGKSTLLSLLAGLRTPTAGLVWVGATELSSLSSAARTAFRRRHLGMVYQADNLLPHLTVEENVALSLAVADAGVNASVRCTEVLTELGVDEFASRYPDQLSGGQRQRVGVARAVAPRPSLVLADEPTGSLDEVAARAVVRTLLAATRSVDATLVLVTHDPDVASSIGTTFHLRCHHRDRQRR